MKECLSNKNKLEIIEVLKEDIQRDAQSIISIEQNVELVKELSVKKPEELLRMYRDHLGRREIFLDKVRNIRVC